MRSLKAGLVTLALLVLLGLTIAMSRAVYLAKLHDCKRIADVHEVYNDSTYGHITIELCHGPVR